jgi:hypothetical protein
VGFNGLEVGAAVVGRVFVVGAAVLRGLLEVGLLEGREVGPEVRARVGDKVWEGDLVLACFFVGLMVGSAVVGLRVGLELTLVGPT